MGMRNDSTVTLVLEEDHIAIFRPEPPPVSLESLLAEITPLPVELTFFNASTVENRVTLKWNTATEENNYGFDIERKGAHNWSTVGFVEGHGTTSAPQTYTYTDNAES